MATVEAYVLAIHQVCEESGKGMARVGEVAKKLGMAASTVVQRLRKLVDAGLVVHRPHKGVRLSRSGEELALRLLRRQRLLEVFLVRVLEMTGDEVHEEAKRLEVAVSDRLVDRIDRYLNYPGQDPHGDPIPRPGDPRPSSG